RLTPAPIRSSTVKVITTSAALGGTAGASRDPVCDHDKVRNLKLELRSCQYRTHLNHVESWCANDSIGLHWHIRKTLFIYCTMLNTGYRYGAGCVVPPRTRPKTMFHIPGWRCNRCGHRWMPRTPNEPIYCPQCRSPYWNKRRRKK